MALVGCSSPPPPQGPLHGGARPPQQTQRLIEPAPDALVTSAARRAGRGGRCASDVDCGDQTCLAMPGGYCGGTCGDTGTTCDGACVETMRDGEQCLAACTRDS